MSPVGLGVPDAVKNRRKFLALCENLPPLSAAVAQACGDAVNREQN